MLHAMYDKVLRAAIGTRFANAPGAVTLDTGAATVDIAMPTYGFGESGADGDKVLYIVDGIQAALTAAKSNASVTLSYVDDVAHTAASPAKGYVQAADTTCYYLLCLDVSGNVKAVKGLDGAGVPIAPTDLCPFAVVKVVTVGVTFTVGTTNWDASGVTCTKEDQFCVVPASPTFA